MRILILTALSVIIGCNTLDAQVSMPSTGIYFTNVVYECVKERTSGGEFRPLKDISSTGVVDYWQYRDFTTGLPVKATLTQGEAEALLQAKKIYRVRTFSSRKEGAATLEFRYAPVQNPIALRETDTATAISIPLFFQPFPYTGLIKLRGIEISDGTYSLSSLCSPESEFIQFYSPYKGDSLLNIQFSISAVRGKGDTLQTDIRSEEKLKEFLREYSQSPSSTPEIKIEFIIITTKYFGRMQLTPIMTFRGRKEDVRSS